MSAQTRYSYSTSAGTPGGIVDLAPNVIDTFLNAEDTGVMEFGLGVVHGGKPGTNIRLPAAASTAADFVGITVNNRTTEYDLEGEIHIRRGKSMGVMRYGRIYGHVADGVSPAYGDAVHLIITGAEAGRFTNAAVTITQGEGEGATSSAGSIAIRGRFLGGVDSTSGAAPIELFNQAPQ